MAEPFIGYLDRLTPAGWLDGWVIESAHPMRPVRLSVLADGVLLGETIASLSRPDVKSAGHPSDRCGFRLPLPAWAADGVERALTVLGEAGSPIRLSGLTAIRHDGPVPTGAEGDVSSRLSRFDYIRGGRVCGWSLDTATRAPVPVDIFCDDFRVASAACDRFRGDLFRTFGAAAGSFDVELPLWVFDERPHAISVRVGGAEVVGGPRTLTPDEQRLHLVAGALQTNGSTALGLDLDRVADVLLGAVLPDHAALSKESRAAVAPLPADLLTHAAFGAEPAALTTLIDRLLGADALPYDRAATAALVVGHAVCVGDVDRSLLRTGLERGGVVTPYGEYLLGALSLADGAAVDGGERLRDAAERSGHQETLSRLCAETLLGAGLGEDAAALLARGVAIADRGETPAPVSPARPSPFAEGQGVHGSVTLDRRTGTLRGWVYDSADPRLSRSVEVALDGLPAAVVVADLPTMGLAGLPLAASYNGFEHHVPSARLSDDRLHVVTVRATSGEALRGSPLLIDNPPTTSSLGPFFCLSDRPHAVVLNAAAGLGSATDGVLVERIEPRVVPAALMSSNTPETGGLWGHQSYQPWPAYLARLTDVYVDPAHGNVFNAAGELWTGCTYLRDAGAVRAARERIVTAPASIPRETGDALIVAESLHRNFWHWHADCLPILHQARRALPMNAVRPLLPPLLDWQRRSAEVVLGRPLPPPAESLVHVDAVWCSSYLDGRSIYPDAGVMAVFKAVRAALGADPRRGATPNRVFVSRKDATDRVLENEDDLARALEPYGFQSVRLSELDYMAQVRLFAGARIVVGCHGAGLTNIGFCDAGTSVVEIVAASRAIGVFRLLSARAGLNHHWYAVSDAEAERLDVPAFMADLVPRLPR